MMRLNLLKEPVAGLMHVLAGLVAVIGGIALWVGGQGDLAKQLSLLIYSASLVFQYAASSAYHLIRASPAATLVLRKIDHASIFALIAGSFTPVAVTILTGPWRWSVLLGIWAVAVAGITYKMATMKTRRWTNVLLYMGMGWLGVFPALKLLEVLPPAALLWILLEGVLFSIGAVIYATRKLDLFPGVFGFHEIWHLFVIGGTLSHYIFVLLYVVPFMRTG